MKFSFQLHKLKRNTEEAQKNAYNQLFFEKPKFRSIIEAIYLEETISNTNKKEKKIKI
ncbi:hypothetical protein GW796_00670 [archaeon]|nr:hypothetical protein [archaeon]NCQ50418.1 hypothetical protein [archaeon]